MGVRVEDILKYAGVAALMDGYYQGSLYFVMKEVYPEEEWYPWMFDDHWLNPIQQVTRDVISIEC